jgi:hypothetical protein
MTDDITVRLRAPYDAPGGAKALARFAAQVDAPVSTGPRSAYSSGTARAGLQTKSPPACFRTWTRAAGHST